MTADRIKELDVMIMEEDFNMEKYKTLNLEELNYLHEQAKLKRDTLGEDVKEKFNAKAEFFYFFGIEYIKGLDKFYVLFLTKTSMPFVVCDDKTLDDELWIFTEQEQAEKMAKVYAEKEIELRVIPVIKEQYLYFFTTMYYLGVNAVLTNPEKEHAQYVIEKICMKPKWEKEDGTPNAVVNPELQLTMMYFMQEFHQNPDNRDNKKLLELEEEMLANLLKGMFLLPGTQEEGEENPKLAYLTNTNEEVFLPVFTDLGEFAKYNQKNEYKVSVVSFKQAGTLINEEAKGIVVNPFGSNLIILKDNLERLLPLAP